MRVFFFILLSSPFAMCSYKNCFGLLKQLAADSHELRIKELVQLRNDQVTIHTGDLAGRLLVDVLTEDLMEAA